MPIKVNSKEFRITVNGDQIIVIGDFTEREIALIDCIAYSVGIHAVIIISMMGLLHTTRLLNR